MWLLAFVLGLIGLSGSAAALDNPPAANRLGPSFDCSAAKKPLALILCSDPQLSLTDLRFGQAYYALFQSLDATGQALLHEEDLEFLDNVQEACDLPQSGPLTPQILSERECVKAAYERETALWIGRLSGPGLQEAVRSPQLHIALQQALQSLGFLPKIPVAGTYTPGTRNAIAAWQAARGRSVTGLLGDDDAALLAREASLTFPPAASPPPAATVNPAAITPPQQAAPVPLQEVDGTAFAINHAGDFLTNYHVVKACTAIRLHWDGLGHEATVRASDEQNDLAVVRAKETTIEPLRFREGGGIRPGDGIVVLGFPYSGLLSTSPQVTTGGVSALSGIGDDVRFLQLTAPVQPGNSGGPLLDLSGNVVGIVSARINELAVAKLTGSLPQNINFAIKGTIVRTFLDAHQIAYETAQSTTKVEAADVAEAATKSTVLLVCLK
jgi:S1-C subfamily serine protease